jgi:hypothetical protein
MLSLLDPLRSHTHLLSYDYYTNGLKIRTARLQNCVLPSSVKLVFGGGERDGRNQELSSPAPVP